MLVLFGLADAPKIVLISLTVFFQVLVAVRDAVRAAGIGVVDAVVHVEPEKAQLGEAAEG